MKVLKELIPYFIIILIVVLIRSFIITPVRVSGDSMYPTLKDKDIVILKKFDKSIERFNIVVFNYEGKKLIKRVIGLPGEHIKYVNGNLYINNEKIDDMDLIPETSDFYLQSLGYDVIPDNYYFVMGDNRGISQDSRVIGLISKKDITGVGVFRIYPFNKIGIVK
ncbi:MAG: signal peptidase I [Clostridium sp.]|nr:signal peptidase I [Clostridium sp.]MCM1444687.1 signal peptidase I [Candidatus Amulumruptor caecigallinarius]